MDELTTESSADAPPVPEAPSSLNGSTDQAAVEPRRRRRWVIPLLLAPVVLAVLATAAWAIDTSLGGVPRNVRLAGADIGGQSEEELLPRVRSLAEAFSSTPVEIVADDVTYLTTAGEVGLSVDQDRTVEQALDVGGDGFVLRRPIDWVRSFITAREAPLVVQVSAEQLDAKVIDLEGDARTPPIEPALELEDGTLHVVPGKDGEGIDTGRVAARLSEVAATWRPGDALRVTARRGPVAPLGSAQEARAAASEAERLVGSPITLETAEATREVTSDVLRGWVSIVSHSDGTVTAALDPERVQAGLRMAFSDLDDGPVSATFTVEGGAPVIRPGRNGTICCTDDAPASIEAGLRAGRESVELELTEGPPDFTAADAEALGITQAVGGNHAWRSGAPTTAGPGFTTYHAATGARVVNIHRIADLVRGAVVLPGERFSMNEHVGKRTAAKGFVAAGAISNGEHVEEIGGGISQFATTTFNAAFFAGLDIDEYQAHSEYFDRYPRGREATMGYPSPDLVFTNNTPYGILIWTSYTSTSLTVTLYSTPYATAEQTAISEGASGNCKVVTTTRTRTYPDGRTETDKFRARYRPGPGQGC
ncbi:MAG: VanW family protein [Microthrixaceae bacterium]